MNPDLVPALLDLMAPGDFLGSCWALGTAAHIVRVNRVRGNQLIHGGQLINESFGWLVMTWRRRYWIAGTVFFHRPDSWNLPSRVDWVSLDKYKL